MCVCVCVCVCVSDFITEFTYSNWHKQSWQAVLEVYVFPHSVIFMVKPYIENCWADFAKIASKLTKLLYLHNFYVYCILTHIYYFCIFMPRPFRLQGFHDRSYLTIQHLRWHCLWKKSSGEMAFELQSTSKLLFCIREHVECQIHRVVENGAQILTSLWLEFILQKSCLQFQFSPLFTPLIPSTEIMLQSEIIRPDNYTVLRD